MEMTLADIEKSYLEAKDRKTQINILADLNEMEPTTMALLLREMGLDVDQHKMPRTGRDGVDKYEAFMLTNLYAEAKAYREERGRELGRVICNGQAVKKHNEQPKASNEQPKASNEQPKASNEQPKASNEQPKASEVIAPKDGGNELRMALYMWGSYLEYKYGQTVCSEDIKMLEQLIEMTKKTGG